jgi:hypothetical protein
MQHASTTMQSHSRQSIIHLVALVAGYTAHLSCCAFAGVMACCCGGLRDPCGCKAAAMLKSRLSKATLLVLGQHAAAGAAGHPALSPPDTDMLLMQLAVPVTYAATTYVMHRQCSWRQHCISTIARASSSCSEHQPQQPCCTHLSSLIKGCTVCPASRLRKKAPRFPEIGEDKGYSSSTTYCCCRSIPAERSLTTL